MRVYAMQPPREQHPMITAIYSMLSVLRMRQGDEEDLADYAKRLKQALYVMEQSVGNTVFDGFAEKQSDYAKLDEEDAQTKFKKDQWTTFKMMLIMNSCDTRKYGTLVRRLESEFSTGTDNYPSNWDDAISVLTTHRWDASWNEWKQKRRDKEKARNEDTGTSFKQTESKNNDKYAHLTCHCCGIKGHIAPQCKHKDKPRDQWVKDRVFNQYLSDIGSDNEGDDGDDASSIASHATNRSTNTTNSNQTSRSQQSQSTNRRSGETRRETRQIRPGWAGFQFQLQEHVEHAHKQVEMKSKDSSEKSLAAKFAERFDDLMDVIILDSGSTLNTFANPNMVSRIRPSKKTCSMATNGGHKKMKVVADLMDFGQVWFDASNLANILSLHTLRKQYRVTYDSDKANSFFIHTDDGEIEFKGTDEGL